MAFTRRLASLYRVIADQGGVELHAQPNIYLDSQGVTYDITGPLGGSGQTPAINHTEAEDFNATQRLNMAPYNRAVVFGDKIFHLVGNSVFTLDFVENTRYAPGTDGYIWQNWKSEYNFATPSGNQFRNTGLHIIATTGGPKICAAYNVPHSGIYYWRGVTYTPTSQKTGTWSETPLYNLRPISCTPNKGSVKSEIVFQNRLFFIADSGVVAFDADRQKFTTYFLPSGDLHHPPHDLTIFQNRLWHCSRVDSFRSYLLSRWEKSTGFLPVTAITGVAEQGNENDEGRNLIWSDEREPDVMQLFLNVWKPRSTGLSGLMTYAMRGDNNGNLIHIGDWTSNGAGGAYWGERYFAANKHDTTRWSLSVEQIRTNTDMGLGYPVYILTHDYNGATGVPMYEDIWNGSGTVQTNNGAIPIGLLTNHHQMARVNMKVGGAERTIGEQPFGPGPEPRIWNSGYSIAANGRLNITFYVTTNPFTYPNGTEFMIAQYYNTGATTPVKIATMSNNSDGTLKHGGKFLRLAAYSGTPYTVQWDYLADGVQDNKTISIQPYITVTGLV